MCDNEDKDMNESELAKVNGLQRKVDAISSGLPTLKGEDDMIELDPENPHHIEWFND